jgi:DDE superfamily endonuclease
MDVEDMSQPDRSHGPSVFARSLFTALPRPEQRRWAEVYLHGLLNVPGRKTVRKMVDAAGDLEPSRATQSLQQFISQSTWDWNRVRELLAHDVQSRLRPEAWVVNQVVMPKRGSHSAGVARRYVPAQGRVINCQMGFGLFLATEAGSVPIDWSLALGGAWDRDERRRSRARIPDEAVGGSDAQVVLDMVDRLLVTWGLPPAPLVASVRSAQDAARLAEGLGHRDVGFLVEVPDLPEPAGRRPRGAARTRPAAALPPAARPVYRLNAQWCPPTGHGSRSWMTNLVDRRPGELMHLAGLGRRSCSDLRAMELFGAMDFEGRTYPGWHRHMTLVSAAYGYHRLEQQARPDRDAFAAYEPDGSFSGGSPVYAV